MKAVLNRQEVLDHFGINSFRELKSEQVTELYSMIKDMDKDVAKEAIEQFPNFKEYGISLFEKLNESYNNVINANKDSAKQAAEAYGAILTTLQEEFKKDNYTLEEKHAIASRMVDVADRLREMDIDNKKFLLQIVKYVTMAAGAVASIGSAILGVKYRTNTPRHYRNDKTDV